MADFKQSFSAATSLSTLTSALASLGNTSTATSEAINNSTTLYDEIILELKIDGTTAAGAWLDVRVLASIDGGTTYGGWNTPYVVLPALDFQTTDALSNPEAIYHARFVPPQYFKIVVKNRTGASLSASNNAASYQGVYYTG